MLQFALLSTLSVVECVYVGPPAGWFIANCDWPTFRLFSIFAAIPGLALLQCKRTLKYT